MVKIYQLDGQIDMVEAPHFSFKKAQELLGHVEFLHLNDDYAALLDEDGIMKRLPANQQASASHAYPNGLTTFYGIVIILKYNNNGVNEIKTILGGE
jgi:hypothetical protein